MREAIRKGSKQAWTMEIAPNETHTTREENTMSNRTLAPAAGTDSNHVAGADKPGYVRPLTRGRFSLQNKMTLTERDAQLTGGDLGIAGSSDGATGIRGPQRWAF